MTKTRNEAGAPNRLLRARQAYCGLTNAQLAAAAGVSAQTIVNLRHNRHGKTCKPIIAAVAAALDTTPEAIGLGAEKGGAA